MSRIHMHMHVFVVLCVCSATRVSLSSRYISLRGQAIILDTAFDYIYIATHTYY